MVERALAAAGSVLSFSLSATPLALLDFSSSPLALVGKAGGSEDDVGESEITVLAEGEATMRVKLCTYYKAGQYIVMRSNMGVETLRRTSVVGASVIAEALLTDDVEVAAEEVVAAPSTVCSSVDGVGDCC